MLCWQLVRRRLRIRPNKLRRSIPCIELSILDTAVSRRVGCALRVFWAGRLERTSRHGGRSGRLGGAMATHEEPQRGDDEDSARHTANNASRDGSGIGRRAAGRSADRGSSRRRSVCSRRRRGRRWGYRRDNRRAGCRA